LPEICHILYGSKVLQTNLKFTEINFISFSDIELIYQPTAVICLDRCSQMQSVTRDTVIGYNGILQ